jgi:hypothetical protein
MAKNLYLTTSQQSLTIEAVAVKSDININYEHQSTGRYIVELNADSNERAAVPFENLLTFNGLPVFTSDNAVLEG